MYLTDSSDSEFGDEVENHGRTKEHQQKMVLALYRAP